MGLGEKRIVFFNYDQLHFSKKKNKKFIKKDSYFYVYF